MKNRIWSVLVGIVVLLVCAPYAQATENEAEDEYLMSGSAEVIGYRNDFCVWVYAERKATEKLAFSISAAKSKSGFQEVVFGPVYYLTPELQVGVSIGGAQYTSSENSRLVVSVLGYLETDNLKAEVLLEKYGRDPRPYYRVFIEMPVAPISEKLAVGVYGEDLIGWGPRITWSISKNINVWISPLVERSGGNVLVGGIQFSF